MPVVRGRVKYEDSPASLRAGALRSFARVWMGEVDIPPLFWLIDSDEVLTVLQGRLGRPAQPSDSEVDNNEPEPVFPSKLASPMC